MKIDLGFIEIHIIHKKSCEICGNRFINNAIIIYTECPDCRYEKASKNKEYKEFKTQSASRLKIDQYFDGFE